ncbi:MAG: hypothetical protein JRI39_00430 [Deltaproteobacteria bacterium]|nr:hypothetical protein [Deltaproteobacteria bacterium]
MSAIDDLKRDIHDLNEAYNDLIDQTGEVQQTVEALNAITNTLARLEEDLEPSEDLQQAIVDLKWLSRGLRVSAGEHRNLARTLNLVGFHLDAIQAELKKGEKP